MKNTLVLFLFGALVLAGPLSAQDNNDDSSLTKGWRGYLSINYKGGKFVVPYSRIVSVSQHEYLIDGGGKVTELTIDTTGSVIARYYFLETSAAGLNTNLGSILDNRAKSIEDRVGEKTGANTRPVVKHYPDTTHAKTVEFNLDDKSYLGKIYGHIVEEWIVRGGRGDGRTLTIN